MSPRTICELFFQAAERKGDKPLFMFKKDGSYQPISGLDMMERVKRVANGLMSLGLKSGGKAGILSNNRWEWAAADLGIVGTGAADVTIYPTLLPDQVAYILNDSDASILFVENLHQFEKVDSIWSKCKKVKHIVVMDDTAIEKKNVMTFSELMEKGDVYAEKNPAEYEKRYSAIQPEDLLTLIYTSGTTGNPKGVMLTHSNLVTNCVDSKRAVLGEDYDGQDLALSFLPLSHVLERTAGFYMMMHIGGAIAYAESIETVPQNLLEVRPTIMVSVPRLYEKMYARIMDMAVSGGALKKNIFFWALRVGEEAARYLSRNRQPSGALGVKYKIAEKLVFSKLKQRTGGRLKFFISGGAPLGKEIGEFFLAAGLRILEGYGLTETSPVITVNRFELIKPGSVGLTIPDVEIKIAEDGEILCKGPNVMKGYYKNEAATREAIDEEGWFHTGDIGHVDEDGCLVITDRKKELIVTSGGKNVAPQPIENKLKADKYIAQAVLIGDKRKFISALIVPDLDGLLKWAQKHEISETDPEKLVEMEEIRTFIGDRVERVNQDLARYEQVRTFTLLPKELTQESGELTPTLKVKRRIVHENYKDVIDRMYTG